MRKMDFLLGLDEFLLKQMLSDQLEKSVFSLKNQLSNFSDEIDQSTSLEELDDMFSDIEDGIKNIRQLELAIDEATENIRLQGKNSVKLIIEDEIPF